MAGWDWMELVDKSEGEPQSGSSAINLIVLYLVHAVVALAELICAELRAGGIRLHHLIEACGSRSRGVGDELQPGSCGAYHILGPVGLSLRYHILLDCL